MALLILKLLSNYWKGTYEKGIRGVATIYVRMHVLPEIQKTIFKKLKTRTVFLSSFFTITAEIHARSLANFYCRHADRHMDLKFMRRVSEREPAIRQFVIVKKQINVSF